MVAVVSLSHIVSGLPSFLPSQKEVSSHFSPVSVWGPSRWRQSSVNFSSAGHSHRVQSTRNRLLQHGPPCIQRSSEQPWSSMGSSLHGSTGPARSPFLHWLSMGSPPSLWASTCSGMGLLPGLQVDLCSSTCPSFSTDTGVCRAVSLTYPHTSLHPQWCSRFPLTTLSHRPYYHHWWAQPWTAVGPAWSRLTLAPLDTGNLLAAPHKSHPCSLPTPKTLPCKPNTNIGIKLKEMSEEWKTREQYHLSEL